jgi:hypothetical protein
VEGGREIEKKRERGRQGERERAVRSSHFFPPLTTFAYVLQSLVKPPQIPVNPVPLVVERQSSQLIEKWQILLWIFLRLLSHQQDQGEVVHPQSHVVKLVDINQEESVL